MKSREDRRYPRAVRLEPHELLRRAGQWRPRRSARSVPATPHQEKILHERRADARIVVQCLVAHTERGCNKGQVETGFVDKSHEHLAPPPFAGLRLFHDGHVRGQELVRQVSSAENQAEEARTRRRMVRSAFGPVLEQQSYKPRGDQENAGDTAEGSEVRLLVECRCLETELRISVVFPYGSQARPEMVDEQKLQRIGVRLVFQNFSRALPQPFLAGTTQAGLVEGCRHVGLHAPHQQIKMAKDEMRLLMQLYPVQAQFGQGARGAHL